MLALHAASKPSCKKQVGNVKIDLAEDNRGLKQRMLGLEAKLQAMEDWVEQEVSAHDLTNIILSSFLPVKTDCRRVMTQRAGRKEHSKLQTRSWGQILDPS